MSSGRLKEVKTMENYKIVRSKGVRGRSWGVVIFERALLGAVYMEGGGSWHQEDSKNADPFQHYLFFSLCIQFTCKLYLSLELGSS